MAAEAARAPGVPERQVGLATGQRQREVDGWRIDQPGGRIVVSHEVFL
jgi:hypothetical protein